jgi:DNA-binding MarR family transcriptional regulator
MAKIPTAAAFEPTAGTINRTEAILLGLLGEKAQTQGELAERAKVSQSMTSRALDHLVARKLARRGVGGWMAGDARGRKALLLELRERRKAVEQVERWVKALPKAKSR